MPQFLWVLQYGGSSWKKQRYFSSGRKLFHPLNSDILTLGLSQKLISASLCIKFLEKLVFKNTRKEGKQWFIMGGGKEYLAHTLLADLTF